MSDSQEVRYTVAPDGCTLAYESFGTGPPLLYARGWISNLEVQRRDGAAERFFSAISEHRTLIRYDGRGNGLSEWDPPMPITKADLMSDLEATAATIEADSFDLWATTYAGPLAIEFAVEHPERVDRLILDGTFAAGKHFISEERGQPFFQMLAMVTLNPDMVFSSLSFMTDPKPEVSHETRVERLRESISPRAIEQLYRLALDFDVTDFLSEVQAETLILHREKSRSVPLRAARFLAAKIPNASLRVLPGSAHNLYEGDSNAALAAIGQFLGFERSPVAEAPPLPSELLVVLFTDIVGSTAMTSSSGDHAAHEVLQRHNSAVRKALRSHQGTEVKHTGDGIMASFRSVTEAATAVLEIGENIAALQPDDELPLSVRIGINAGEPVAESGDLYGNVVQVASRVCELGGGGEVVVTDVVRELLRGKKLRFEDRGSHRLKGIDDEIRVWQLHRSDPN